MSFDVNSLLSTLVVAGVGVFTFLVKSFFNRIDEHLKDLRSSVDKLGGKFDSLQTESRRTVVDLAVTRQELTAVWRFIDKTARATDNYDEDGE